MPGETLFGEAGNLLRGAAETTNATADRGQRSTEAQMKVGEAASSELGADRRQQMSGQQAQQLAKLKSQLDMNENAVLITPQIALGLVRNTGDKEWMKAVGQRMRSDVVLGMYTHGMKLNESRKAPKITQTYDENGKIRHAVVYTDEEGNVQQLMLDAGMKPEDLNKGKGKGGAGSADDTLKKQKAFMASHEKQAALLNDAVKSKQLQSLDPDQYNRIKEEYQKDQDRYDQLKTELGKAGEPAPAPNAESSAAPENTPFDADALIKEALGNQ